MEVRNDYGQLAAINKRLHEAFVKIDRMSGKRVFGTFFRVGFYGAKFGDLDGEEFVYKEPVITMLPEISQRLEAFYLEKFGVQCLEMVKDSSVIKKEALHADKCYIQITFVEPYFDRYKLLAEHYKLWKFNFLHFLDGNYGIDRHSLKRTTT